MNARPFARRPFQAPLACIVLALAGCGQSDRPREPPVRHLHTLSAYGLFVGNGRTQEPVEGVIPYDLNTPLFSDYTTKHRFIKLPPGESAKYRDRHVFEFPVGTIVAKTFAMRLDRTDHDSEEQLLETRIMIRQDKGWVGLPYVWNAEQTDAVLRRTGGTVDVRWIHDDGTERTNSHIIPNMNQCKGCHKLGRSMMPIGPKARHLNREFKYAHGAENQLAYWSRIGVLIGAPSPEQAPRLAVWNDPGTGTLAERARAWLEINCAHCHNPLGPASNAGIDLMASQTVPAKIGVFKSPAAAGRGAGGLSYDIVPGKPDESILAYRIGSIEPEVMMPELGKRMVHAEGLTLVRQWIREMETFQPSAAAKTIEPRRTQRNTAKK